MSMSMRIQSSPTLSDLPAELLELILQDLPFFDLFRVQRVSRRWNALVHASVPLRRAMFKSAVPPSPNQTFSVKPNTSTGGSMPPTLNPLLITTQSTPQPEAKPFTESLAYLGLPKSSHLFESDRLSCPQSVTGDETHGDTPDDNDSQHDQQLRILADEHASSETYEHDNDPLLDGADSPSNSPHSSTSPSLASFSTSPTTECPSYPDTTISCVLAAGSSLFTVSIPSPSSLQGGNTGEHASTDSRAAVTEPLWMDLHIFQGVGCKKVTITMQDLSIPGLLKCVTVQGEDEVGGVMRGVRMGDLVKAVFPS